MDDVEELMHPEYLPVTESQMLQHFADVGGSGDPLRHLTYYRTSLDRLRGLERAHRKVLSRAQIEAARQLEKDERFWIAAALLGAFHPEQTRVRNLACLLADAFDGEPASSSFWEQHLEGGLRLYFEANLPAPTEYKQELLKQGGQQLLVRFLREAAAQSTNLEGTTKADALLLNEDSGVAVIFEAKVLSDASTMVRFDPLRNQIARTIDVMLEDPSERRPFSLRARRPDETYFVLVTPEVFKSNPHTRFYGRVLEEYRKDPDALARDLPHRKNVDWDAVSKRLGWLTYERCAELIPGSCAWLRVAHED